MLLNEGADRNIQNDENMTSAVLAREQKCVDTYFLKKNYGNESSFITEDGEFQFVTSSLRNGAANIQVLYSC